MNKDNNKQPVRARDLLPRMGSYFQKKQAEWEAKPESEKRLILEKRRQAQEAEKQRELIDFYKAKGIPERFWESTWDNWTADSPAKKHALITVKTTAWNTNLFLYGRNGTGKTHLAMCLVKAGATYRRLSDIFREVREKRDSERTIINRYGSVKLLIVDEAGRPRLPPFEMMKLINLFFDIIDKRWNNMLPTTLITNLATGEFSAEYGAATLDRLRPVPVHFDWESYRHRETLRVPSEQANW
ncbi:MAG: ATP-binding protein [Treponema sp.]|jgi:DNA replication protein DnaC|nr:ATP-binding protein [Treponema sp.]